MVGYSLLLQPHHGGINDEINLKRRRRRRRHRHRHHPLVRIWKI